eukprot:TRINITY_DN261_c0_g3_i1.p1 TRINITY_DN261_c0_g3~~TRINITY_DN261_c0_g3_i1.p1  ORF type:complete len:670 (-),score=260.08 TRINITY_DN261_c0_g3_i1:258-2267(-)
MPDEAVKVVVRCRPMNKRELDLGCGYCIEMVTSKGICSIINPKDPKERKDFTFDSVFDWESEQGPVYAEVGFPLVKNVLDGFNGTIFAYGQTGCGKSFSMTGVLGDPRLKGIIPRAFDQVFDSVGSNSNPRLSYLVRISYLEIYNEDIRDLLSDNISVKLELKENPESGVYVKDLGSFVVGTYAEVDKWMEFGNKQRAVGETKMNATSSRSHSIFTCNVETCEKDDAGEDHIRGGKLNLVDLAGSERQSKTEATGQRLKEAAKINLSLSALGNVISALVDGKSTHVPYRDSKLTRLLQDSLGGNAKTVMLTALSPADNNYDEGLSTLRYANRAKNIKNKPKINEDPKDAMIRQFQDEIKKLKEMLERKGLGLPVDAPLPSASSGAASRPATVRSIRGIDQETLDRMKTETDEQVMAALAAKNLAQEERDRIMTELREIKAAEAKEAEEKAAIEQQLAAMQGKMHIGGVDYLSAHESQVAKLRLQEQELEQIRLEEERVKRHLAQQEENLTDVDKKYASLQDEINDKNTKLKKLFARAQDVKMQQEDLKDEYARDKTDILDTIREQTKLLKLKMLIINNFIPPKELQRIDERASWDNDADRWRIHNLRLAGCLARTGMQRSMTTVGGEDDGSVYTDDLPAANASLDGRKVFFSYEADLQQAARLQSNRRR